MRRSILVALPTVLLIAQPAWALNSANYFPQNDTAGSRPTIGQQVLLAPGETVSQVTMQLEGQQVPAAWNAGNGCVAYTPATALAPGNHQVVIDYKKADSTEEYSFHFAVGAGAATSEPQAVPDENNQLALNRVNQYRTAAGLPPMIYKKALQQAAQAHVHYMAGTGDYGHVENETGSPLFVGAQPWDRTAHFGYTAGIAEVLDADRTETEAIDDWMGSLYHRLALLTPDNTEMGFGREDGFTAIEAGPYTVRNAVVLYPAPGQQEADYQWFDREEPDPLRLYPGTSPTTGPVITATFGSEPAGLTLSSASLTGSDGSRPGLMRFSPGNDSELDDTVAVIPYAPLHPGTTYTVRMAGSVTIGAATLPWSRTWSFSTKRAAITWTVLPVAGAAFADTTGHWAGQAIESLVADAVISGYPDGTYRPNSPLTRAAFVKMLVAALGLPLRPGDTAGFAGVTGHWLVQQGYLGAAARAGILQPSDYPGQQFRPDESINRGEIATLAVRAAAAAPGQPGPCAQFPASGPGPVVIDGHLFADAASWPQPAYVIKAAELGIVTGYAEADGTYTFRPQSPATRAEAAAMVTRLLNQS